MDGKVSMKSERKDGERGEMKSRLSRVWESEISKL